MSDYSGAELSGPGRKPLEQISKEHWRVHSRERERERTRERERVCVCVREREAEKDIEGERDREREGFFIAGQREALAPPLIQYPPIHSNTPQRETLLQREAEPQVNSFDQGISPTKSPSPNHLEPPEMPSLTEHLHQKHQSSRARDAGRRHTCPSGRRVHHGRLVAGLGRVGLMVKRSASLDSELAAERVGGRLVWIQWM